MAKIKHFFDVADAKIPLATAVVGLLSVTDCPQ